MFSSLLRLSASTFRLTSLTLCFYCSTTLCFLISLTLSFFSLLFSELFCLFVFQLPCTLFDFRFKILANFLNIGVLENAGMTLSGNFHLRKTIEQLLAGHIKFFCQFMYTHARHIVSSSITLHEIVRRVVFVGYGRSKR